MKLELFGKRILLRCDAVEETKVGRIIIQEKHSERTRFATVIAIGNEVDNFIPGDRVLISWYTGSHLHILGGELFGNPNDEDRDRMVMESEILGRVVSDKEE